MKYKAILNVFYVCSVLIMTIVIFSQASRAQTSKTMPSGEASNQRLKAFEEWPNLSAGTMHRVGIALNKMNRSVKLTKLGDAASAQGNWQQAKEDYQQAQALFPDYSEARYGIGQCDQAAGKMQEAIECYRANIYSHDARYGTVPGDGYQENNVGRLMEYVLLLSKTGQSRQALTVYERAAGLLNYEDDKQNLDVLLPDFSHGGWSYTPQRLQAMAHIAIAYGKEGFYENQAMSHLQQAVALAPDSAIPYYYRGRHQEMFKANDKAAKADFAKAAQLGNAQIRRAAVKFMNAIQ